MDCSRLFDVSVFLSCKSKLARPPDEHILFISASIWRWKHKHSASRPGCPCNSEHTDFYELKEKCWKLIRAELLISHYNPPFKIATARDFFLKIPCISAQWVFHPVTSINHLPSSVEKQMHHLRCAPRVMSLKGKTVWWCDNGSGKPSVEPAAFLKHREGISGNFRRNVYSSNS